MAYALCCPHPCVETVLGTLLQALKGPCRQHTHALKHSRAAGRLGGPWVCLQALFQHLIKHTQRALAACTAVSHSSSVSLFCHPTLWRCRAELVGPRLSVEGCPAVSTSGTGGPHSSRVNPTPRAICCSSKKQVTQIAKRPTSSRCLIEFHRPPPPWPPGRTAQRLPPAPTGTQNM